MPKISVPKINIDKNTLTNVGRNAAGIGGATLGRAAGVLGSAAGAIGAKDITDALFNKPQVPGMPNMDGTAPPDLDKVTQDANDAQRAKLGKRFSSGAGLFGGLFGGGGMASRTSASSLLGF